MCTYSASKAQATKNTFRRAGQTSELWQLQLPLSVNETVLVLHKHKCIPAHVYQHHTRMAPGLTVDKPTKWRWQPGQIVIISPFTVYALDEITGCPSYMFGMQEIRSGKLHRQMLPLGIHYHMPTHVRQTSYATADSGYDHVIHCMQSILKVAAVIRGCSQ